MHLNHRYPKLPPGTPASTFHSCGYPNISLSPLYVNSFLLLTHRIQFVLPVGALVNHGCRELMGATALSCPETAGHSNSPVLRLLYLFSPSSTVSQSLRDGLNTHVSFRSEHSVHALTSYECINC